MPQPTPPVEPGTGTQVITAAEGCARLDAFVPLHIAGVTRSRVARLVRDGAITLNGRTVRPSHPVRPGDVVAAVLPEPASAPRAESIDLSVVYEDADVVVLDKPAGLVVHPAPGHPAHTLVNALLHRYPDLSCGDSERPGVVHRLDKDTSGLIVIARTETARAWMVSQFKQGLVRKEYAALVTGEVAASGTIEGPIGRHPGERKRMAVVAGGKPAQTDYRLREVVGGYSYVSALPRTGRTHQIRVHFASIGHPVAGDRTYGGRTAARQLQPWLTRHFLHAELIAFRLPGRDEPLFFRSPLPADLQQALAAARGCDVCCPCPPRFDVV